MTAASFPESGLRGRLAPQARAGHGEDERYQPLLEQHHCLGAIPKIGQTLRYVARHGDIWVALLSFSTASLKCAARDRWIGWDARLQYGRLKLIANNSRFLILPDWHLPNLGSKVLALSPRRLRGALHDFARAGKAEPDAGTIHTRMRSPVLRMGIEIEANFRCTFLQPGILSSHSLRRATRHFHPHE